MIIQFQATVAAADKYEAVSRQNPLKLYGDIKIAETAGLRRKDNGGITPVPGVLRHGQLFIIVIFVLIRSYRNFTAATRPANTEH